MDLFQSCCKNDADDSNLRAEIQQCFDNDKCNFYKNALIDQIENTA